MSTPSKKPDAFWLNALNLTLGSRRIRKLLATHGSPHAVWELSPAQLKQSGISEKALAGITKRRKNIDPDTEWERLQKRDIRAITLDSEHYPKPLKHIHSSPLLLYVRGNLKALNTPSLAIVGTRRFSSYGKTVVERLVPDLVRAGLTIVSGLAQGIDAISHAETLRADGTTVAILGNGIDTVVPTRNKKLAKEILDQSGAIVSEYPWGVPPLKQHFPARNRIIAGMAKGTLVIESRVPGGSLITAEHALEEAREVFAVPGNITTPASEGTNKLIMEGAHPVTSAADILEILNVTPVQQELVDVGSLSKEEQEVLAILETEPLYIDTIIKQATCTPAQVGARLTALELKGLVKNLGGNTYQRLV